MADAMEEIFGLNNIIFNDDDDLDDLQELEHQQQLLELQYNWRRLMRLYRRRAERVFWIRRLFHDSHFLNATGFTRTEAEHLLLRIGHRFMRATRRSWAVTTPQLFIVVIRFLRTGNDFWNCGMFVGLSRATTNLCFWQFIDAVIAELSDLITIHETENYWRRQATIWHREYGISHAVGAIDGSYIKIKNIGDVTAYFCRKQYPAINLTIFSDARNFIRFISCKWAGSMQDGRVYRNSELYRMQRNGWEPFPGAVVLADSAYIGIRGDNLLLPHPKRRRITPQNRQFYIAQKNARHNVECVIGRLKGKFNILSVTRGRINFHTRERISRVIKACCILYNFLLYEQGEEDDEDDQDDFDDLDPNQPKIDQLIEIFNNEH